MDYALLAATALGAVGLYLMLPRERATLARLGVLLSGMALAGFFLFLVRSVATGVEDPLHGEIHKGPPGYFYLFAFVMIAGAVGVVCQPRPVYAALYFVLVTLAGAGLFVLLMADFMAIVLIIIYAGAILVTYVFVIMLASQSTSGTAGDVKSPEYDRRASEPFIAVVVAFVLVGAVLQVLYPSGRTIAKHTGRSDPLMVASIQGIPLDQAMDLDLRGEPAATLPAGKKANTAAPSGVQVLGANLYSRYPLTLELAGILLTIALIGAVVIARKNTEVTQALGTGKLPSE